MTCYIHPGINIFKEWIGEAQNIGNRQKYVSKVLRLREPKSYQICYENGVLVCRCTDQSLQD